MALAEFSALLEGGVHPAAIALLLQVGITLLYVRETGLEKLDVLVGEVS